MLNIGEKIIKSIRREAKRVLLNNYEKTGKRYITPAWPHYRNQWLWDSCFHAISASELGLYDLAKNELERMMRYQTKKGWIPHQTYSTPPRWFDIERFLYGRGLRPKHSSLVAPPVLAQAVEAINDQEFTRKYIEQVASFYKYYKEYRDAENIFSIFSPRESGRDADPIFDFYRFNAPKFLKLFERVLDVSYVLILDFRNMLLGWDEKKLFKKGVFHVKDIGTHCIWVDGLYALKSLLMKVQREDLFLDIDEVIKRGEEVIFEKSYNEHDKTFYSIRKGHGQIRELSLGSLFPILLKNLPKKYKEEILDHIKNPKAFWTNYPIPSVPVLHPRFDPSSTFPIWRGPTWINSNWFLIRGLVRNGYVDVAKEIAERTLEIIDREGFWEFYNPFTGKGLRVKDFGWSTLAITFPRLLEHET